MAWPIVAAAGGSSLLLWSTAARAWVPVALSVAQAGFQLYQMSRSGGGGIGKLLAAQVEMLRAINLQLREIAQTVTQIYAGVEQLKDMVQDLPLQVTRQIYRAEVQAVSEYGSRLLDNGLINTQNRGIADAIILDNGASQQALDRLGPAVNAVISDPSVLNVPLMCLAWYTEYQLLTRYVPFNPARIATTAALYQGYLERNIATLNAELAKVESEAATLTQQVGSSPIFESADCVEDRSRRIREDPNSPIPIIATFSATFVNYAPSYEPLEDGLASFLIAESELEAAGVSMPEVLSTRVPRWSFSRTFESRVSTQGRREWQSFVARLDNATDCVPGRSASVASYYHIQGEVQRSADNLRIRAIVNNHLLLAASEALRSCLTIAQRVTSLDAAPRSALPRISGAR